MKYQEFYEGFKDNITGNEYKQLMTNMRVIAELLDIRQKYSEQISSYKFYREFMSDVEDKINKNQVLTDKQKITIYFIKKSIESSIEKSNTRYNTSYYRYNSEDSSSYSSVDERKYVYESHECNGNCGGCRSYGTCSLGDDIMYERENSGGI